MANPEGKGGFQERMDDINRDGPPGHWSQMSTILQRIGNLSPSEFQEYIPQNMKEQMVYKMLQEEDYKEVFDRIDGKAKQTIEQSGTMNNILTFEKVAAKDGDE